MSFLEAMSEAEEPLEVFYIEADDGLGVWKSGASETMVQEAAEADSETIYFAGTEKEVFE